MYSNTCEWGNGQQCPNESREDGSIYAQFCDDHAHTEAELTRAEFGTVCLWCGTILPDDTEQDCEDGGKHGAVPAGFPFHSDEDHDAVLASGMVYAFDNDGKWACDNRGAHDPGAAHTYDACPMAGLPARDDGNPAVWGWQS